MDNRVKYTRKVIKEAFLGLLKEKKIEEISITDICRAADINRTTFYRHFNDQNDLLNKIEGEKLLEVRKELRARKASLDDAILVLIQMMAEDKEEWCLLFNNQNTEFLNKINKFFDKTFMMKAKTPEEEMRNTFITSGTNGIMTSWFKNGMKESPEELAGYIKTFRLRMMNES